MTNNIFIGDTDIISITKKCYSYIIKCETNNTKILIHCQAGKSRSASVIIYYLMKKNNISFNKAYNILKQIKPDININIGFYNQLNNI